MILGKRRRSASDDHEGAKDDAELVVRVNNVVYFYSEVTRESVLRLATLVREATSYVLHAQIDTGCKGGIYLHICSSGGSVFDGLAAMDMIAGNPVSITTVIEGCVCSAATFLALGGHCIKIRPYAHVLIHQVSSAFWGRYEDFNDEKQTLDNLMKTLRRLYSSKTAIPAKTLSQMFKRDMYIDANDCIKWKIAHEFYTSP